MSVSFILGAIAALPELASVRTWHRAASVSNALARLAPSKSSFADGYDFVADRLIGEDSVKH